ncbi:ribosome-associated translation inhibitor RaiA [Oligoflexia bacterium]|nr:ribosome-associated translation inhibitor RaiA [Oligoflexia bacterium]
MVSSKIVNVNIAFKNTEATAALKTYATEKVTNCLKKFIHHDTEAHVVLKVEKNRHIAEIRFNTDGTNIAGSEESADLYASIDTLVDSLASQLRKHKEKMQKKHH